MQLTNPTYTSFFENNPEIDLLQFNFFDQEALDALNWVNGERSATIEALKKYQRIIRLHADETVAENLLALELHSAQQIAALSWPHFQKKIASHFPEAELETLRTIHNKAQHVQQRVTLVWAQLKDLASPFLRAMPNQNIHPEFISKLQQLPGYDELFGTQDFVDVQHEDSILSPSAYFTDLMRLIYEYITVPNATQISAGLQLKTRRRDLYELPLDAERTLQSVPYISIINKVLENNLSFFADGEVASATTNTVTFAEDIEGTVEGKFIRLTSGNGLGQVRQLKKYEEKTATLNANWAVIPVEKDQFDILTVPDIMYQLATTAFPFQLPFQWPLESIRAYISYYELSLAQIFKAYQRKNLSDDQIAYARELLLLSREEYELYTTPQNTTEALKKLYGIPDENPLAYLGNAKRFATQTALARTQLIELFYQDLGPEELPVPSGTYTYTSELFAEEYQIHFSNNPFNHLVLAEVVEATDATVLFQLEGTIKRSIYSGIYVDLAGGTKGSFKLSFTHGGSQFHGWIYAENQESEPNTAVLLQVSGVSTNQPTTPPNLPAQFFINQVLAAQDFLSLQSTATLEEGVFVESTQIAGLTNDSLDHINRFVRLASELNWTYQELDYALASLMPPPGKIRIDEAAMVSLSGIKYLKDKYNLSTAVLGSFWYTLKTYGNGPENQFGNEFDRLFNSPTPFFFEINDLGTAPYHPTFSGNPLFTDEIYPDWQPQGENETDILISNRVCSAIGIGHSDLITLIVHLRDNKVSGFTKNKLELSVENLSVLFRYAKIAAIMQHEIEELLARLALLKIKTITTVEEVIQLSELDDLLDSWGINAQQITYAVSGRFDPAIIDPGYDYNNLQSLIQDICLNRHNWMLNPLVFVNETITEEQSRALYQELVQNKSITADGIIIKTAPSTQAFEMLEITVAKLEALGIEEEKAPLIISELKAATPPILDAKDYLIIYPTYNLAQLLEHILEAAQIEALEDLFATLAYLYRQVKPALSNQLEIQQQGLGLLLSVFYGTAVPDIHILVFNFIAAVKAGDFPDGVLAFLLSPPSEVCQQAKHIANNRLSFKPNFAEDSSYYSVLRYVGQWCYLTHLTSLTIEDLASIRDNPLRYGWPEELNQDFELSLEKVEILLHYKQFQEYFSDLKNQLIAFFYRGEISVLEELTNWKELDIEAINDYLKLQEEASELTMADLWIVKGCFDQGKNIGVSVSNLISVCDATKDKSVSESNNWRRYKEVAAAFYQAIQQNYPSASWEDISREIEAPLLEKKKEALKSSVKWHLRAAHKDQPAIPNIENDRDLYEYLLLDVEMSSCAQISPVKEGTLALQLYLQRCLMNLEKGVQITSPALKQWWEWMGSYRLWEANRKVFLYPENYLDPTLIRDTSAAFDTLKDDLLQGELNEQNITSSYYNYLDGLSKLANLQIIDAYYEVLNRGLVSVPIEELPPVREKPVLFLFARTRQSPHIFYYRQAFLDAESRKVNNWNFWDKIDVNIPVDQITPVYAFKRLFIFWVERVKEEKGDNENTIYKLTLKYATYNYNRQWSTAQELTTYQVTYISNEIYWRKPFAFYIPEDHENENYKNKLIVGIGPFDKKMGQDYFTSYLPANVLDQSLRSRRIHFTCQKNQEGVTTMRPEIHDKKLTTQPDSASIVFSFYRSNSVLPRFCMFPGGLVNREENIATDQVSIFDLQSTSFIPGPSLPLDLFRYGMATTENHFFVAGGSSRSDPSKVPGFNHLDLETGVWTELPMAEKRSIVTSLVVIGTKVLIAGGGSIVTETFDISNPNEPLKREPDAEGSHLYLSSCKFDSESCLLVARQHVNKFSLSTGWHRLRVEGTDLYKHLRDVAFVANLGDKFVFVDKRSREADLVEGHDYWIVFFTKDFQYIGEYSFLFYPVQSFPSIGIMHDLLLLSYGNKIHVFNLNTNTVVSPIDIPPPRVNRAITIYNNLIVCSGPYDFESGESSYIDIFSIQLDVGGKDGYEVVSYQGGEWLQPGRFEYTSQFNHLKPGDLPAQASIVLDKTAATAGLIPVKNSPEWFLFEDGDEVFLVQSQGQHQQTLNSMVVVNDESSENRLSLQAKITQGNTEALVLFHRLNTTTTQQLSDNLFAGGVDKLLTIAAQSTAEIDFKENYHPTERVAYKNEQQEIYVDQAVSFRPDNPFGAYYRELFYSATLLMANTMRTDQRFEQAQTWYRYLFDPINIQPGLDRSYWNFLPFRELSKRQSLGDILADTNAAQIAVYENDPFDPFPIAWLRLTALEKYTVMQYVGNLLSWGDYLFAQDTWESINQATLIYVKAQALLGATPESQGPRIRPPSRNFNDILAKYGKDIPIFLFYLENVLASSAPPQIPGKPYNDIGSYFGVPENGDFISYWKQVEDRLYKVRHCLNLQGQARELALFEPALDVRQLVRTFASGAGLAGLSMGNSFIPHYRFKVMIAQAKELTSFVIQLGANLLSTLEKKDAEALSLLKIQQEQAIQRQNLVIKQQQLVEIKLSEAALQASLGNATARLDFYQNMLQAGLMRKEIESLDLMIEAASKEDYANALHIASIPAYLVPSIFGLASGGVQFGSAIQSSATALQSVAALMKTIGTILSTQAQYDRRNQEWGLQERLAEFDQNQIMSQINANAIQYQIAQTELELQQKIATQMEETAQFLRSKFTNEELYQWMINRLSVLYFQAYKLAHEAALAAEKAYQFECYNNDTYIEFGGWDSLKKGLLSGESLMFSLHQLEKAFTIKNRRELEIEKTVSLKTLDRQAFEDFKNNGILKFGFEEAFFNYDYPGHYNRRIKTIAISIPAILGPYQNFSSTLTQLNNKVVIEPDVSAVHFLMSGLNYSPSLEALIRSNWRNNQQIAISSGISDSGLFYLNYDDERYLPFEGTGAISNWVFEITEQNSQDLLDKISDVIVTIKYTALDGGSTFAQKVKALPSLQYRSNSIHLNLAKTGKNWDQFQQKQIPLTFTIEGQKLSSVPKQAKVKYVYGIVVYAEKTDYSASISGVISTVSKGRKTKFSINFVDPNQEEMAITQMKNLSLAKIADKPLEITIEPAKVQHQIQALYLGIVYEYT